MKARAFIAAAAMLLVGATAYAQAPAHASVSVPISVSAQRDMQINDIGRNVCKTVKFLGDLPANGTTTAQFKVTGDQNDWYVVSNLAAHLTWQPGPGQVLAPEDDGDIDGSNMIERAYNVNNTSGEQMATHSATSTYQLTGTDGANNGESYLWVGGDFCTANNQQRGMYLGTVTMTIAYQ